MKHTILFGFLSAALLSPAWSLSAQDLFEARFKASSTGAGVAGNRDTLTEAVILERSVEADVSKRDLRRDYLLVYNATSDRLQVIRSNSGELVSDILIFSGGNATWSSRQSERLAIVYLPGSDAPIGSALITERASVSQKNQARAAITARLQFVLPSDSALAGRNPRARDDAGNQETFFSLANIALPDEDARVYTGLLTTGKSLEFDGDGSPTAPGAPGNGAPAAQDIAFIRDAVQMNLAEVQMGGLMVQKAQSAALRAYGQHLVNDHTAALQQLIALATQEHISVPTSVSSADRERLRRLGGTNGSAFETVAQQVAVQVHEDAIAKYETAVERAQDADIRGFARAQLPNLRAHLQTARNLVLSGDEPTPSGGERPLRSPFARTAGPWF